MLREIAPWVLVPGVIVMIPMVALRARWGSSTKNARFIKVLVSAALMMTLTIPAVGAVVDEALDLRGVQTLICDTVAIYLSRQAALAVWEETSDSPTAGRTLNTVLTITSTAGVLILFAAYARIHQGGADLLTLDERSLRPVPLTFWVTFCLVHGTNMAFTAVRAIQARRGTLIPISTRDRTSLTWWVISALAIWAYILNFPVALSLIATGRQDHFIVVNTQLLQALPGLAGCITGAVCAATWADVGSRLQHLLHRPGWAWATRTEDDVVLFPFMHTPAHRLARRTTETTLALDRLLSCTTPLERAQVGTALRRGTLATEDAWGVLVHLGRRRRLDGQGANARLSQPELPPHPRGWWRLQRVILRRRRFTRLAHDITHGPRAVARPQNA